MGLTSAVLREAWGCLLWRAGTGKVWLSHYCPSPKPKPGSHNTRQHLHFSLFCLYLLSLYLSSPWCVHKIALAVAAAPDPPFLTGLCCCQVLIMGWFGMEGTLKTIQRWSIYSCSGQSVSGPPHPHREQFLPSFPSIPLSVWNRSLCPAPFLAIFLHLSCPLQALEGHSQVTLKLLSSRLNKHQAFLSPGVKIKAKLTAFCTFFLPTRATLCCLQLYS